MGYPFGYPIVSAISIGMVIIREWSDEPLLEPIEDFRDAELPLLCLP